MACSGEVIIMRGVDATSYFVVLCYLFTKAYTKWGGVRCVD